MRPSKIKPTMLNSIDTPVGDLDDFIESDERCLQRSELYQQLDCGLEVLLELSELLATARQAGELVCVGAVGVRLEDWEGYTWKLS